MRKKNPGLGPLIRQYRTMKGMSQADLGAKLSKKTAMFISLMELNKSKVPTVLLGQMIVHLGIPEKKVMANLVEHYRQLIRDEIEMGKKMAMEKNGPRPENKRRNRSSY